MPNYNYTLVSCNPALYADQTNLCHPTPHPYELQYVYIVGSPVDETYFLRLDGVDSFPCSGGVPNLALVDLLTCDPDYEIYEVTSCTTGTVENVRVDISDYSIIGIDTTGSLQEYDYIGTTLGAVNTYTNNTPAVTIDKVHLIGYNMTNLGRLYYFDPNNLGSGQPFLVDLALPTNVFDIAYNPVDGYIYACANTTNNLYRIDLNTLTYTDLGALTITPTIGASGGGLTFNDEGVLYLAAVGNLYLVNIGTLTANAVNASAISTSGVISGLTFYKRNTFFISDVNKNLYSYDLGTDTLTLATTFTLGVVSGIGCLTTRPNVGNTYVFDGDCGCWEVTAKGATYDTTEIVDGSFEDCSECLAAELSNVCPIGERTKGYANRIKLPKQPVVDKGFEECCFSLTVLAQSSGSDDYKNDYTGFYDQKQLPSDTVDYSLIDVGTAVAYNLIDDTYGIYKDFGAYSDNPNLKTFIIEWQKVLTLLGAGSYQFEKTVTVAGVGITLTSNTYHLKEFSDSLADKTTRIDIIQNGKLEHLGIDFKGTDFKTALRLPGFFGRRQPSYEQDNVVFSTYKSTQISMDLINEYSYQTELLPSCITKDLFEFYLLANDVFLNDYNINNHDYTYEKLPVELSDTEDVDYNAYSRKARIQLKFKDRFKNTRKINC